jgi:hypothetical protein
MIANELKTAVEKYGAYRFTLVDSTGAELEIKEINDGKIILGTKVVKEEKTSIITSVVEAVKEVFVKEEVVEPEVEMINPSDIMKKKKK